MSLFVAHFLFLYPAGGENMNQSIGKLLPVDGFRLSKRGDLPKGAHQSLTHLYQPIIGRLSVSLYQTLISEYEMLPDDRVQTHHTLMSYLSSPLDKIYEARQRLEAIGLLRTFRIEKESHTEYMYKLYPPFSPEGFFHDEMLPLLLTHEIGEEKFNKLKERLIRTELSMEEYREVTVSFDEVFHAGRSISTTKPRPGRGNEEKESNLKGPLVEDGRVDFSWLHQALKQRMFESDKILTGDNKRLISQLASLYDLTSIELEKALTWAINENQQLEAEEFKTACHDFMKEKPSPIKKVHLDLREKMEIDSDESISKSKSDQFIDMLERISPRELLEDLSGGNRAADHDLKTIRDVMTEQGLSPGVMNVLVHYVMLKTDMKLSKPYLEKIASHWTRKNVTTVRQAMNLAKAEHQKYQQWGQQKSYRKNNKEEVIPAWFNQQKSNDKNHTNAQGVNKEEIAQRIKRLTNKGNGL